MVNERDFNTRLLVEYFEKNPDEMVKNSQIVIDFIENYKKLEYNKFKYQTTRGAKNRMEKRQYYALYYDAIVKQRELFEKACSAWKEITKIGASGKSTELISPDWVCSQYSTDKSAFGGMKEFVDIIENGNCQNFSEKETVGVETGIEKFEEIQRLYEEKKLPDIDIKAKKQLYFTDVETIKLYIRKCPEEMLRAIKNLLDYRCLRQKEAYYAQLVTSINKTDEELRAAGYGMGFIKEASSGDLEFWKYSTQNYNSQRRDYHNSALTSFNEILKLGKRNNLPPLYLGEEMNLQEILKHDRKDIREAYTNAFFEFLNNIQMRGLEKIEDQDKEIMQKVVDDINNADIKSYTRSAILEDESELNDGGAEFE